MMKGSIDISQFKNIVSKFPTGIIIMTTNYEEKDFGITINSFTSVSLEPQLILFCIDKMSGSYEAFLKSKSFVANFLTEKQEEIAKLFAIKGIDKFKNISFEKSENQNPILINISAYLELEQYKVFDAGDHDIIIGKVIDGKVLSNENPVCYYNRNFISLAQNS